MNSTLLRRTLFPAGAQRRRAIATILALLAAACCAPVQAFDAVFVSLTHGESPGSVTFSATNLNDQPVSLLKIGTPLDPLLDVDALDIRKPSKDGQFYTRPIWAGPIVKRLPPSDADFVWLQPGETVSSDIVISDFYEILSSAEYTIAYRGKLTLSTLPPVGAAKLNENHTGGTFKLAHSSPSSNTMHMTLERTDRSAQTRARPARYESCTATQQGLLVEATDAAERITNDAFNILRDTAESQRPTARRYTEWFGPYDASRYESVIDGYRRIGNALSDETLTYDCSCDRAGVFAFIQRAFLNRVNLCPVFWQTTLLGTDSRAGTLIHELSHFSQYGGTEDHAYGQPAARDLARSDPARAVGNADNFGYFAENNPALAMSGGSITAPPPRPQQPEQPGGNALPLNTPLAQQVVEDQAQLFDVYGANAVTITPQSGDPDLYIYSEPSRTRDTLVCRSIESQGADTCTGLTEGVNYYVAVIGYTTSDYQIEVSGSRPSDDDATTGGTSTGGTSTGGTSTGSTGGTSDGGSSTGGMSTGGTTDGSTGGSTGGSGGTSGGFAFGDGSGGGGGGGAAWAILILALLASARRHAEILFRTMTGIKA